jgi:hypothetical protein
MDNELEGHDAVAYESFAMILDHCVQLADNEELLVIYDESLGPYLGALLRLIHDREIACTLLVFPKRYQSDLVRRHADPQERGTVQLPRSIIGAIAETNVILNLLDGDLETAPVRGAILTRKRAAAARLAHIPGLTAELLEIIARTPMPGVLRACELVAWVLGECRSVELMTFRSDGGEHKLTMDLSGWDNEPLMSPGIILPGAWGNVPPGETFCCPDLKGVNGSICINGSVPNSVIPPGGEVVLYFEKGELHHWEGEAGSPAVRFLEIEQAKAGLRGDPYWRCFAEFGVGLNPAITTLTGNSLMDEKAIRTVHVALGDNTCFGHPVDSGIHADLVTCGPTLICDGHTVIERGDVRLDELESRRDALRPPQEILTPGQRVQLRDTKVAVRDGQLQRRLYRPGRVAYVRMADEETGRHLASLFSLLKPRGEVEVGAFVTAHPSTGGRTTGELLNLLHHYCTLNVSSGARVRKPRAPGPGRDQS